MCKASTFALASLGLWFFFIPVRGWGQDSQPLPDFGVMYNNDGDMSYASPDPTTATQILDNTLDALSGSSIKTFMYSIGSDSDIMHYPTQVANTFGWRTTPYDNDPAWVNQVTDGRIYAQDGYDPVQVVGEKVKSMGMYFIPSYRMNGDDFLYDPQNSPLTGQFWLNNQDLTLGSSPVTGFDFSKQLNFAASAVRNYRMSIIDESIDRYASIMDGYELDFNHTAVFFPPGQAQTNAQYLTDMVQQVRQKLDQVSAEEHRPEYLFVRISPTLANDQWSGMAVEQWISEGLVDVVEPAQIQTLAQDMPIDQLVNLAKGTNVKVYPSIYPVTDTQWNFSPTPAVAYAGSPSTVASLALTLGALSNYQYLGGNGIQLTNYSLPLTSDWNQVVQAAGSPDPTSGKDRVFAITPSYFVDPENTLENAKQVPYTVSASQSQQFTMLVGDSMQEIGNEHATVILRLGLSGLSSQNSIRININGQQIYDGPMNSNYFSVPATSDSTAPTGYFQLPLSSLSYLRQGDNSITINNPSSTNTVPITDIQLGVFGSTPALPAQSSWQFEHAYEGQSIVISGGTASGFGTAGYSGSISNYTATSDGNVLNVQYTGSGTGVFFMQNPLWNSQAKDATGWTWETRFRVISATNNGPAFTVRIGDGEGTDQDILAIYPNSIQSDSAPSQLDDTINLTTAFHTLRVAQAPGSQVFNVWLDNQLLSSYTTSGYPPGDNHWFGDGSSTNDGAFQIDYIRWTADGGFSPVATRLLGDFNLDGAVTNADLQAMLNALHNLSGYMATNNLSTTDLLALGDFNHDGVVNSQDIQGLISYLTGAGELLPVPEPSSIELALAATMWSLVVTGLQRRTTVAN